ncbi:hypothetical protein Hsar01_01273 [Haloferula sargassicola]|uniref:Uncharacterized protein n=2 Tax=Haloferula sargassicola TaxID=490096 RepID=A0ABP9UQJ1_9BACT
MNRTRFIAEMQDVLKELGYQPDPNKRGTLQDVSSARRLGLIWDMNLKMAAGYAKWKAEQDEDLLDEFPAWELTRELGRVEVRDWPAIWAAAGGEFFGEPGPDYPSAPGRMMAMKTDPIWAAISQFGTPWPPFRWGSGMGLTDIDRDEAEELGVVLEDTVQGPLATPFNSGFSQSIKGLPEPSRERLRSEFGDTCRIDGDRIFHQRDTTEANEHRAKTIREELRARARSAVERGEAALERLRREDDAAEALYGSEEADGVRRTYLAQLAAVENGRKGLFHEQITEEAAWPLIEAAREAMPSARVEWKDGHLLAWRPDLDRLSLEELAELSGENPVARNGMLLGYGMESPAALGEEHVLVLLVDGEGNTVSGFHAPLRAARIYAEARLRDLTDGLGPGYDYRIIERKGGGA